MSKHFFLILLTLFCFSYESTGQDSLWVKSHPVLSRLINAGNNNLIVYYDKPGGIFKTRNKIIDKWEKTILHTPSSTFITINGTGIIYKYSRQKNDSTLLVRIDNTVYLGYNFFAITFESKEKIYSFGGEGFWKTNGQLREFSNIKREWDIISLNTETPTLSDIYFYDKSRNLLFYYAKSYNDYATNKKIEIDKWYALDINRKKINEIGETNNEIIEKLSIGGKSSSFSCYPLASFSGTIISDHVNFHKFIDFKELKIYNISNKKIIEFLTVSSVGKLETLFSIDSTIYYSVCDSDKLDSIKIKKIFWDVNSEQSIIQDNKRTISLLIIILFVFAFLIIFIFYLKKCNQKNEEKEEECDQQKLTFNIIEKIIIDKLINDEVDGISIEAFNDILGLTKKSLAVQKKHRNEFIKNINNKFKIIGNTEDQLIARKKEENDKRSYIYFINDNAKLILKNIE